MKLSEVRGARADNLSLRAVQGTFSPRLQVGEEVVLFRDGTGLMLASSGGNAQARPVVGVNAEVAVRAGEVADNARLTLCWVAKADAHSVVVAVHRFHRHFVVPEVVIALDDKVVADLRREHRVGNTALDAANWLAAQCFCRTEDDRLRAVICAAREGELETFRILGARVAVDVRRTGERFLVVRVAPGRAGKDLPVSLLEGKLRFSDMTATAGYSVEARRALEEAVQQKGSYLPIWDAYSNLERESLEALRDHVGRFNYTAVAQTARGYRFTLVPSPGLDARIDELERRELALVVAMPHDGRDRGPVRPVSGLVATDPACDTAIELVRVREDCLVPPERGWLELNVWGDERRLARREAARQKLRLGNCPMPWVGLMLEGRPSTPPRYPKVAPRGPAASRTTLTSAQLQAVGLALNTPDIALIQGPPGTGKTEFIRALQERVAELAAEGEEPPTVLVTSAQHDTVEHLVARSDVFGLPAVKIGERHHGVVGGLDPVERFCDARMASVAAALGDVSEPERLARARADAITLLKTRLSAAETARLLRHLIADVADLITPAVHDQVLACARELERPGAFDAGYEERKARIDAIRAISTSTVAFLDGGPRRALVALVRARDLLTPDQRAVLEACAEAQTEDAPTPALEALLERAKEVQEALLDQLAGAEVPVTTRAPERDLAAQRAVCTVLTEVRERLAATRTGIPAVVSRWLHELEWERESVRQAIRHYTAVLASTLQHADSRDMLDARGTPGGADFGTVIVDEAARCHPLDLFIPMAMAKRRIVFVGDQRQLPHMLEPEVERTLSAQVARGDFAADTLDALERSLFARLWDIAGEREEADQVCRRITLDTQFRMHPVLGDFVSRVFYERHGQAKILPGRPAAALSHTLAGYLLPGGDGAVACFMDVPGGPGAGEAPGPRGHGFRRPAEARVIAAEVQRVLQLDETTTIGVIAFYRDQTSTLLREFERCGLASRSDDGTVQLTAAVGRRVQLGTVDAFQGKEFDVVFLSVTRSNAVEAASDLVLRRKYGHLLLENRLCVAMSRQKRLLVLVGDLAFVRAAAPLEALTQFVSLCEGPHGLLR